MAQLLAKRHANSCDLHAFSGKALSSLLHTCLLPRSRLSTIDFSSSPDSKPRQFPLLVRGRCTSQVSSRVITRNLLAATRDFLLSSVFLFPFLFPPGVARKEAAESLVAFLGKWQPLTSLSTTLRSCRKRFRCENDHARCKLSY